MRGNHQFEANLILRTDPQNFIREFLGTPNPTQKDLAPEDAIGKSFLMPPEDDGTRHRARIIEIINDDRQRADERKKALIKFKCLVNNQWEEVVAYNQISDFIEQGESWVRKGNVVHKMKEIAAHKGPLKSGHPEWKGSLYNVKIIWWDGSTTWEPVTNLVKDDPVTLAAYVKKNNL
jgi:hypothetical protein